MVLYTIINNKGYVLFKHYCGNLKVITKNKEIFYTSKDVGVFNIKNIKNTTTKFIEYESIKRFKNDLSLELQINEEIEMINKLKDNLLLN